MSEPVSIASPARDQRDPVSEDEMEGLMAAVGPFEAAPMLAVAVSGGGDSMALGLLADTWARRREGRVTALTVDHGLRPEAAEEACRVGRWLASRGIEHRVLNWRGDKSSGGLQARARDARYRLMTDWCRRAGVLHLLLAHQMEDQAETFLLRLGRGSGPEGLSGMAAVTERAALRLVRPLLEVPGRRLRATLETYRQEWIEDPSNHDPAFARTLIRRAMPELAASGMPARRLAAAARLMGRKRTVSEARAAQLLARCCVFHPAGFAGLDPLIMAAAPEATRRRVLARVLMCVGGRAYAPRGERLERVAALVGGGGLDRGMTLGGCRIVPMRDRLLVCREGRGQPPPLAVVAGTRVTWDARFVVEIAASPGPGSVSRRPRRRTSATLARLGREGWARAVADMPELRLTAIPSPARPSLPALFDEHGVFMVPHLDYKRQGKKAPEVEIAKVAFGPANSLSGIGFFLLNGVRGLSH